MTKTLRPHSPPRLLDVDALRGFALFGILVVNLPFFASGYPFHLVADPAHGSWLDDTVEFGVRLLFEMKFYLLFSFLFGYSFTLQLASAERAGANFSARFVRRLGGLFVLGGLHAVLLFHGDILATYALLGLVLLAVHRIRPRTALISAGVIFGVMATAIAVAALSGVELVTDQGAALADGRASTDALDGGLGSVIGEHVRSLPTMAGSLAVQGPLALAAFFVGLAAGRRELLADGIGRHGVALRRLEWVGYPVGLAGALVFAIGGGTVGLAGVAVTILTAPLLTGAYVATLLRVFATPRGGRLARVLAPAGRMALSNYLGQSLLGVLIFTGAGLGLTGDTPPALVPVVAVGIFAAQLELSRRWLARYRYGPVEWVLRAVTNAELPRMRRRAPETALSSPPGEPRHP
ncbi:DUF418 domain-containing protein [Streptomyces roseirectus]|uniref:DUF418 domain-containing protein n=1 Tax=Streptomyces roseirectus TaxID=2768066 RepID=A0A7H0IPP8_9ACTN|nr:DUF418 domain-containing protein [Streptomyces roseirectus]QNP74764.1 DUF418 domain-containing protein [Streptomyces roseirectus]